MKKRLVSIAIVMCMIASNFVPVYLYAGEITKQGNELPSIDEENCFVDEENLHEEVELDGEIRNEYEDSKVIVLFEDLPPEIGEMHICERPTYDELVESFPETIQIYTRDGQYSGIEVEWSTTEQYETDWEEINFYANISEDYTLAEGVTLPTIKIEITSPENYIMTLETDDSIEGTGSEEDPYLIYSVDDFAFVRENKSAGIYYKLMNDIDLSSVTWTPLGLKNTDSEAFCANFDGNGHKIYNLEKISSSYSSYGIFGYVRNASICNLGVVVKDGIRLTSPYNGGIMMNTGTNCIIDNCYVIGEYETTSNNASRAGILAQNFSGSISNCYIQGYVSVYGNSSLTHAAYGNAGGIVGNGDATITNCLCIADVYCDSNSDTCYSGGISCGGKTTIQNCLFVGETRNYSGKVIGQIYGASKQTPESVENSYYSLENSANPQNEKYGSGKTVAELRDVCTYEGWDFENTWTMNDLYGAGFPMLKSMQNLEREMSKYLLPVAKDYSQRSGQVILSNSFEFEVWFDREIDVIQNNGVYLKDASSGDLVQCEYYGKNGNGLYIKTKDEMKNGKKYTLVIEDNCVADTVYPMNYYGGQEGQYFVTVCGPKFEGDGSIGNPYVVSDAARLNCVYYQPSMNYVLSNDIDASGVSQINSIGACKNTSGTSGAWISHYDTQTQGEKSDFTGIFDGKGYTIKGVKKFSGQSVNGYAYDKYIGLFSSVKGGTIKNLNVVMADDCYLYNKREGSIVDTIGYPYISILVAKGNGRISNCTVKGTVYSNQETTYAGMIAGQFDGIIENCASYGTITNEYNSSRGVVGGLVGYLSSSGSIRNSYAIASVNGASSVCAGGLVGSNKGLIANTYAAGNISKITNVGGLVGTNTGSVTNSFYDCMLAGTLDSDRGTPMTSSQMKSIGTYYAWDFANCWAINSKHNGGYPFLKGSAGADIGGTPTIITVFDGKDGTRTIQNPTITFLDNDQNIITQYEGDDSGVIALEDIIISGDYSIKISAEGYGTYTNDHYSINAFSTQAIILYPQTDTPTAYCVNVQFGDGNYVDVLQKKLPLSEGSTQTFDIYVAATYTGEVDNVCLVQEGKIKKQSSNGIFKNISARDFDANTRIYVEVIGKDGKTSNLYQTYLTVVSEIIPPNDFSASVSKDISIDIDSDIPFLGGATIKISDLFDDLEFLEIEAVGGKTKFTINIDPEIVNGETSIKDNTPPTDESTPIKKIDFDKLKELLNYKSDDKKNKDNQYWKQLNDFTTTYCDAIPSKNISSIITAENSTEIDGKIFGYVEIDNSTGNVCCGKIAVVIDCEAKYEAGFALASLPCVLIIDLKVSAEGSINIKIVEMEAVYDYCADLNVKLSGGLGPGIPKLASATFNGSGELEIKYDWNTYLDNRSTIVNLTASTYWKLKILSFEMEKTIAEKKWCLYDSNSVSNSIDSYALYNVNYENLDNNFSVSSIDGESGWNGSSLGRRSVVNDSEVELLSSVYGNSCPQIVQLGDNMMMFFLHQNETRTAINSTEIMYSIYDNETQTWENPKPVYDDGTADFYPQVAEYAGEVFVIWENMRSSVDDDTGLSEFAEQGEIAIAKYDSVADTFEICTCNSEGMISTPYLDESASKVMWVTNESDSFLNDSDYAIQVADYDGNVITNVTTAQRRIEHLIMAKIGTINSTSIIAYLCDYDGDYSTTNDHVLKIIDESGNVLFESPQSAISDVEFYEKSGQTKIAFSDAGRIFSLDNYNAELMIEGNIPVNGEFKIINGSVDYVIFEKNGDNSEINLYAYSFDETSQRWCDAVQITKTDSQITSYDAIPNDIGMQLVYQETSITNGVETASLHTKAIEPRVNLGIYNVVYNEDENKLSFSMDITNSGLKNAEGYIISVYDGTDILYTETVSELIEVAESKHYEHEVETNGVKGYQKTLDIVVTPNGDVDADESDNEASIVVGYPDISIILMDECLGENTYIAALELYNGGNCSTSGDINVYVEDLLIDTISVSELAVGEYRTIPVNIDTRQLNIEESIGTIKFEFVSSLHELYLHDNVMTSNVFMEMDSLLGNVDAQDVSVNVGDKTELLIDFFASSGDKSRLAILPMTYSVQKPSVASVSEEGIVTGINEGTTTLIVTATDIFGNSASDICVVSVSSENKNTVFDVNEGKQDESDISITVENEDNSERIQVGQDGKTNSKEEGRRDNSKENIKEETEDKDYYLQENDEKDEQNESEENVTSETERDSNIALIVLLIGFSMLLIANIIRKMVKSHK